MAETTHAVNDGLFVGGGHALRVVVVAKRTAATRHINVLVVSGYLKTMVKLR